MSATQVNVCPPITMLEPSDRALIAAAARGEAGAFGELYRRHCDIVLAFFLNRTGAPGLAADLTAETFAVALAGCRRYRPDAPPPSWLFAIARRLLAESRRRGAVEDRARRRVGLARLELDDGDIERIAGLRALLSPSSRERLGEARREAVRACILDELDHPDGAGGFRPSPAVAPCRRDGEVVS